MIILVNDIFSSLRAAAEANTLLGNDYVIDVNSVALADRKSRWHNSDSLKYANMTYIIPRVAQAHMYTCLLDHKSRWRWSDSLNCTTRIYVRTSIPRAAPRYATTFIRIITTGVCYAKLVFNRPLQRACEPYMQRWRDTDCPSEGVIIQIFSTTSLSWQLEWGQQRWGAYYGARM